MKTIAIIFLGSGVNPPDVALAMEMHKNAIEEMTDAFDELAEAANSYRQAIDKALVYEQYTDLPSEEIEDFNTRAAMVAVPPVRKQDLPVIPIWQTDYG